jgi:hypothetical protein
MGLGESVIFVMGVERAAILSIWDQSLSNSNFIFHKIKQIGKQVRFEMLSRMIQIQSEAKRHNFPLYSLCEQRRVQRTRIDSPEILPSLICSTLPSLLFAQRLSYRVQRSSDWGRQRSLFPSAQSMTISLQPESS